MKSLRILCRCVEIWNIFMEILEFNVVKKGTP
jgi:hypothetical protein